MSELDDRSPGRPSPDAVRAWELHAGTELDPERLRAELVAGNLPAAFHRVALEHPDAPALSIGGESVTHGELDDLAGRAAAWLRSHGVDPGERVVICGANSLGFVTAYLGTLRAGATAVLAGAGLTERELRHIVERSGAIAAFAGGDGHGRLRSVAEEIRLDPLVAIDPVRGATSIDEVLGTPESISPEPDPEAIAILGFTSGTTGAPKGAPLSHANVLASVRGIMLAWRWSAEDVLVHSLPMTHQHGLAGLQATLLAGSRAVIHDGLDPPALCASIASERATVLFAVPSVYERLLGSEGIGDGDFSSLRLATCGSAPLAPALWGRVAETIGAQPLERYGTTETGLDVSNPYDGPRKAGKVGIPLPGIEVALVEKSGSPVDPGADGEIVVRGPQAFAGYWRDQGATRESFYPGGWFRTGDIGRIDPSDGYLAITGRIKELIISGGMNVYPREVELVLEEHPAVARAAVVGAPSKRWGEAVVAFVVASRGSALDEAELRAHARALLAPYKSPKAVIEIDALPVNEIGKIQRATLVELAGGLEDEPDKPNAEVDG